MTEDAFLTASLKKDYLQSQSFIQESESLIGELTRLIDEYKNEEHILNGGSSSRRRIMRDIEQNLYHEYFQTTSKYNPNLTEEENVQKFKEEYADQIKQAKEQSNQGRFKRLPYHYCKILKSTMNHCFMQVMVQMYFQIQR